MFIILKKCGVYNKNVLLNQAKKTELDERAKHDVWEEKDMPTGKKVRNEQESRKARKKSEVRTKKTKAAGHVAVSRGLTKICDKMSILTLWVE